MKTSTKILIVVFLVGLVGTSVTMAYLFSAINIGDGQIIFQMTTLAWVCLSFLIFTTSIGCVLYYKFLKTRKFNSMLFFSMFPLSLMFGFITYILASIKNFNSTTFVVVKAVLNINATNYNNYLWLAIATIIYFVLTFLIITLLTTPVKKIEVATKHLSYGEIKEKINIGGSKQFLEIEQSLNKINENYKQKDDAMKQTSMEYEKFVPKQLVKFLGKRNVLELEIGSQTKKVATSLFCNIRNSNLINQTLSLEENFNYINSYLNVVSPIIRKYGGFVDKYLDDGILAVFVSPSSAMTAGMVIARTINQKNLEQKNMPNLEVGLSVDTGEVIFGVVGDEVRKSVTVISNTVSIASKLNEINTTFGSTFVISKQCLNALPSTFKFDYRYIANVNIQETNEVISVFEVLDVYPRQKREKLKKFHTEFENGVRDYINGKFDQAKDIFEKVYKKEKDDKICYVYYNKCCESMGNHPLNLHE